MGYVDGFVLVVPKKKLAAYKKLAQLGAKVWMEYGALQYFECVGDDLTVGFGLPFPKLVRAKKSEAVLFSWILHRSKAARDRVNAKVMKDPRLAAMCGAKDMPFDMKRMSMGGFEVLVKG